MGVARHDIFMHVKPDICIIDEAGQVSEPIVLGPLFHCSKFILVGDPKQLPPLIRSRKARALDADISLMERLCDSHPKLGPFSGTLSLWTVRAIRENLISSEIKSSISFQPRNQ